MRRSLRKKDSVLDGGGSDSVPSGSVVILDSRKEERKRKRRRKGKRKRGR